MPKTEASDIPLGTLAPEFRLPDAEGRLHSPSTHAAAPALLVAFLSNRCPYVLGIRAAMAELARRNASRGLRVIAVNSNDADAHPEEAAEEARAQGYPFPYLKDETQEVARLYGAACTPDLFLFDADRRLVYHGQFDGFRPGNGVEPTGADLQRAVDAALAGGPPLAAQVLPVGCNIKWRPADAASGAAPALAAE